MRSYRDQDLDHKERRERAKDNTQQHTIERDAQNLKNGSLVDRIKAMAKGIESQKDGKDIGKGKGKDDPGIER